MSLVFTSLLVVSLLVWSGLLVAPWRPFSTRETLQAHDDLANKDLGDVTVLIPARNEVDVIERTLQALNRQGEGLRIVVVDDQSSDGTAHAARGAMDAKPTVVRGAPVPAGWSGKVWALEQGRARITTALTLLLDADIELCPGMLAVAKAKLRSAQVDLLSVLAAPRMESPWEKLSMPAFVYFFKLLYPFRLCNSPGSGCAAAAGGFVLVKTRLLDEIGGFRVIKNALIDDCALAKSIKRRGGAIWLGLSLEARSLRRNEKFADIGRMVSRTAFTQLNYSSAWLGLCTLVMLVAFWLPAQSLLHSSILVRFMALGALAMMMLTFLPTLKFYNRSPAWALTLPLVAMLYLALTWASAFGYWRGRRSVWKGRVYPKGHI